MIPTTPVNKGFGFLFEMGCGKTLTAIAVAGAGYQQKRISRVLIVAPTSVVAVWPKEFQDYAAFPYTIRTLLGTKQQRLKALADLERFPYPHLKVAVINYESTWREEIFDALLDFDADLVIADESQRIKSHDAAQSKAMHQLGDKARYKLILSGTPVQNEAVDLWSQYRFLDPTIFGTNFYAFRSRYCEMGGFNRKQIVRYRDLDTLIRKEHSIAYRVTKEEALDLPEQTFESRYITLSRSERNLYDRLRRDSYAELADGGTITATGGEPMLQIDFLTELFTKAKQNGIHTALDTCGILFDPDHTEKVEKLMAVTDLVLLDIKHMFDEEHKKLTGHSNARVFAFAEYLKKIGKPVWIRHVVVPGITFQREELLALGRYLKTLTNMEKLEVLPYHSMGKVKYDSLGIEYPLLGTPQLSKAEAAQAEAIIREGMAE